MATVVDQLIVDVKANTAQAVAGLGAVQAQVGGLQAAMVGLASTGKILFAALTVPILAVGAIGVKSFMDFDAAMTQSLAIMGDVSDAMRDDMAKAAREVAKTTTFSASEAAEAYFFLASAGFSAEQSIAAMPQVAKFAQAGMFDMATATDLATDAQSALGLKSDDAAQNLANLTRVTDVFTKANVLANTSVQQISEAMTNKAGAALRAVGKDIEEGSAVLAAFADQGLKGAAAGTALHIVMRDLQTAAIRNEDAFTEMGLSVFDADGEMRNMADIVGDMEGLLDGMSDKQKKATLAQLGFTDKSIGFIQMLLGTSDAIRGYEESLRDASGYTADVAAKQLETFSAQWALFKSKLADVAITIGSALVPRLAELLDQITPHIERMAEWIEQNTELAIKIAGVVAAIGPALFFVGKLATIIGLLASPIGIVLAAIGGLIWIAKEMGVSFDDVKRHVEILIEIFKNPEINSSGWVGQVADIVQGIHEWLVQLRTWWDENFDGIMAAVQGFADFLVQAWEDIYAVVGPLVEQTMDFINTEVAALVAWFEEIWPVLLEVVEAVLGFIQKTWERVWPIISAFIVPVWGAILKIISGALDVIKGIIKFALNFITGNWGAAWEGILQVVKGIWKIIQGVVRVAWEALKTVFRLAIAALQTAWSAFWLFFGNAVKSAWRGILGFIKGAINMFLGFMEGFVNGVIGKVNTLIGLINKIPGVNVGQIGNVNLPRLAHGGETIAGGMAIVGDSGPERIYLPKGAQVAPLSPGGDRGGGPLVNIERMMGHDAHGVAAEIGWQLAKRGYA